MIRDGRSVAEIMSAGPTILPADAVMEVQSPEQLGEAVSVLLSSPQQAKDNAAVSSMRELSDELHERLRTFYLDRVAAHIRGPY